MSGISKRFASASFAIAVMAGTAVAADFTFNGDMDFRLREETNLVLDSTGKKFDSLSTSSFSTVYAWNLKAAVKVNDNLGLKFRLSNPKGSGLETVARNEDISKDLRVLSIPQAEIQYKVGFFGLSAGIIEVPNSTVLNLTRAAEEKGYAGNIDLSSNWSTLYNNSQAGLKFSFDAGKFIDVNVVTAIAEFQKVGAPAGFTDLRVIADAPVTIAEGKYVITPSLEVRSGLTGNYDKREMNYNGGVDFSTKFSDMVALKAGAAYGRFTNADSSTTKTDITTLGWNLPAGLLISVTPTVKFGMNTVSVGYSFGQAKDRDMTGDAAYSLLTNHIDAKWGLELAKGFSITPRYRMWMKSNTLAGTKSYVTNRPEIMFTAKF